MILVKSNLALESSIDLMPETKMQALMKKMEVSNYAFRKASTLLDCNGLALSKDARRETPLFA